MVLRLRPLVGLEDRTPAELAPRGDSITIAPVSDITGHGGPKGQPRAPRAPGHRVREPCTELSNLPLTGRDRTHQPTKVRVLIPTPARGRDTTPHGLLADCTAVGHLPGDNPERSRQAELRGVRENPHRRQRDLADGRATVV